MNTEEIVFNAILARRSIRYFDDAKPVEKEKLDKLMQAAMAAPSACNIQPWEFIIVTQSDIVEKIRSSIKQFANYNTNTIIVVCGSNDFIPWKDNGIMDCALAMGNIMIAAPTLGLGTVCIGGFDRQAVKEILNIPENVEPIGMLYIGYPKEVKNPRTKYLEEAVHWESFDNTRERKPRPGNVLEFGPEASL
ncbi:MAG: nitroreductase family protein [Anaerolineae bacterium]|nr:nitroreductase family protein [Anaerolineae bacterium]